jgi:hypothetical protein
VLSDILEFGKAKSAAASFGSVMHAAVAAWWQNSEVDAPSRLAISHATIETAWQEHFADVADPGTHTIELAHAMFDGYMPQAKPVGPFSDIGNWQRVSVETRLELPLASAYVLSFMQDRVYYNREQDWLVIVDLKTASRLDARWQSQWYRSLQMKLYRLAGQLIYQPSQLDIVIEGLQKGAKPKLQYLALPAWSAELLREAEQQFAHIARSDYNLLQRSILDSNVIDISTLEDLALTETAVNYADCNSYNYECAFLPLCTAEPDERKALLHASYKQIIQDY